MFTVFKLKIICKMAVRQCKKTWKKIALQEHAQKIGVTLGVEGNSLLPAPTEILLQFEYTHRRYMFSSPIWTSLCKTPYVWEGVVFGPRQCRRW